MFKQCLLAAIFITAYSTDGMAAENVIPITPPGGTDLDQAILPPAGLYGALVTIPYAIAKQLDGQDGKPVPAALNLKLDDPITAAAFAYVYPFDFYGGHFLTSVVLSYYNLTSNSLIPGLSQHISGLGDTYSDVLFYSKNVGLAGVTPGASPLLAYGLTLAGGLAIKAPTGVYNAGLPINIGSNVWLVIPNFAATYVSGSNMAIGDSTEVSTRVFFGVPFTNPADGYTSGNILNIDYSISEVFGALKAGVAGYYQEQVSSDTSRGGVPVEAGGKFSYFAVGPVVEYTFANGVSVKAKYDKQVYAAGTVKLDLLALTVATKF